MTTGCAQGYLIDKATADKHNITNIDQIIKNPEIAKLFDSDGDGKANLTGCDPGWGCERVIEHQMDAFDMRGSVNHDQGSYFALIANTIARYEQGDPVFYYTWTPMWLGAVLVPGKDVVWLNVPFNASPDDPNADTSAADGSNSGFAMNAMEIVANSDFLSKHPAAKHFFELFRLPLGDIAAQNLKIHNGENKMDDFIRHADEWIVTNQDAFDSWVAAAKKVGL
jgi:glycine betaine/proline transport system substrate-binding protein